MTKQPKNVAELIEALRGAKAKVKAAPPTVAEFAVEAPAVEVVVSVNGQQVRAVPKQFSSGSLGWHVPMTFTVNIGGRPQTIRFGSVGVDGTKPKAKVQA